MPLPITTVGLVALTIIVFIPKNLTSAQIILAIVLYAFCFINEFLRMAYHVSKLQQENKFYEIPAAPQQPVAHRDVPE